MTLEISARQLARVIDAVVHFGRMHAHAMARPKQPCEDSRPSSLGSALWSRQRGVPEVFHLQKVSGDNTNSPPETLGTGTMEEKVLSILMQRTEGAGPIIVCSTRVQPSICVEFSVMEKPNEGPTARRSSIAPDAGRKNVIRKM